MDEVQKRLEVALGQEVETQESRLRLTKALEAERKLLEARVQNATVRTVAAEVQIPQVEAPVQISTIEVVPPAPRGAPVVIAHGFGAGKGVFFRNLEALATEGEGRRVLAFDWLGQGCSSRPEGFPSRPTPLDGGLVDEEEVRNRAVNWFTASLDAWRRRVLPRGESFVLVAHSVGGFLATHYAMQHPGAVERLVLVSPAGLARAPEDQPEADVERALARSPHRDVACFSFGKPLVKMWNWNVTPQSLIRLGAAALGGLRPGAADAVAKPLVRHLYRKNEELRADIDDFSEYIYSINVLPGCSEYLLTTLFKPADRSDALRGIYARHALADDPRLEDLCETTVLYGDRDWMLNPLCEAALDKFGPRGATLSVIPNAGHQIHLDNPRAFNRAVVDAIHS